MSRRAQNFWELDVYGQAFAVAQTIFQLSKTFPKEESYSLTDQIRRASRSVGAHIAEAWGNRRYKRYFVRTLAGADSEQLEVQHWVRTAAACGYLSRDQEDELSAKLASIGRMLQTMMDKAHLFCRPNAATTDHRPPA
ncbi:MAG: four helix bundle protein [Gemmatimonadota bacterium]|nr:MAG: four helix bundle protein [Gemmatimonadota bacterium]